MAVLFGSVVGMVWHRWYLLSNLLLRYLSPPETQQRFRPQARSPQPHLVHDGCQCAVELRFLPCEKSVLGFCWRQPISNFGHRSLCLLISVGQDCGVVVSPVSVISDLCSLVGLRLVEA